MPPQFSEDDIDDLLYFARAGELQNFKDSINAICGRTINSLLAINDASSGNGPLHMAAANGHAGRRAPALQECGNFLIA